ncbi:MAG: PQQ-binding-like beta-propeller repeat protein [Brevefilum sp.]|nr:PQQ-binding-like beta-propeller repeat protein [Brevefilum sp.]
MKKTHILLIGILAGLSLVLSACMPGIRVVGTPGTVVSEDRVYVSYGNQVYALNAASGNEEWHYPEESNNQVMFYAPPVVTDAYIYVGDIANTFHKIDKATGAAVWTFTEAKGYFIGQANEDEGVIYAPSNNGNLYAIDADGNLKWIFETDHFLWAQPQIGADAIYQGSMDHYVYAISKDGDQLWATEMAGAVVGSVALSEDGSSLFVGSIGEEMVALNTADGSTIWTFAADDSIWGRAVVVDQTLYFGDSSGTVFALDVNNGQQIWRQQSFTGSIIGGLSVLPDGIAFVTEEGTIKTINFDGSPKWEASISGQVFQAPAVNDQYLVVGAIEGDNLVYAYNLAGTQIWSRTPEK